MDDGNWASMSLLPAGVRTLEAPGTLDKFPGEHRRSYGRVGMVIFHPLAYVRIRMIVDHTGCPVSCHTESTDVRGNPLRFNSPGEVQWCFRLSAAFEAPGPQAQAHHVQGSGTWPTKRRLTTKVFALVQHDRSAATGGDAMADGVPLTAAARFPVVAGTHRRIGRRA